MDLSIKLCAVCGEPTKRHSTAKYCWDCQQKMSHKSYLKQLKKHQDKRLQLKND